MTDSGGWHGFSWRDWDRLDLVRERLAAGADPNAQVGWLGPALHHAAERGSAAVVAELAGRADDVDAMHNGHTALWLAVASHRPDNARALVEAGADPSREMMSGWSPARLSLTGPGPDLAGGTVSLTPAEAAAVAEHRRLAGALGDAFVDGLGIACVAGINVAEAVRRLNADVVHGDQDRMRDAWREDPNDDEVIRTMWATDVPGGCVMAQPWGYGPQMPGVTKRLSAGTVCYGMYANPKSGNQGSILRDGEIVGWDLHPGGGPHEDDGRHEVLLACLYQHQALAYCFAYAGLRPTDDRSVSGPPDVWLRLPPGDYWA